MAYTPKLTYKGRPLVRLLSLIHIYILADIAPDKKTVFDAAYADALYTEYKNRRTDDTAALAALQAAFCLLYTSPRQ